MRPKTHCPYCGNGLIHKNHEGCSRLFCGHCLEPIYENPIPATCLVVVDDQERLLLVKRSVEPKKGWWCLPGGYMELGETPEAGAVRELSEETGLSGNIRRLLGVTSNPSDLYHTVLMVGYHVRSFTGTLQAGDDAADIAWFDIGDLPEVAFMSHRHFIETYYETPVFGP